MAHPPCCRCGKSYRPEDSVGSLLFYCQDCWEERCAKEWWEAVGGERKDEEEEE